MLVLPTSTTTAIILEQPTGSPLWVLFGYVTVALLLGTIYCGWEMLFSAILGRRPSRSRWVMLLAAAALFASGVLTEGLLLAEAQFNGVLDTYWGFVLSPWFFLAFIPCAMLLIALRIADAKRMGPFFRVPVVVWWCAGWLVVSAYGVAALWMGGRAAVSTFYVTLLGFGLAIAGIGSLVAATVFRWRRREGAG